MKKCPVCGKERKADGFGCFACEDPEGRHVHSLWCRHSDKCEAKI